MASINCKRKGKRNTKMNLIFISSYLNVPCVISTIESNEEDFRIITSNKQIQIFFNNFYKREVSILIPDSDIKLNNIFFLIQSKKKFFKQLRLLNPKKIFFYYLGNNGLMTWLISKFSKEIKVYYRLKVHLKIENPLFNFSYLYLKIFIKKLLLNIVFENKFRVIMWYGNYMIIIPKNFLNDINANYLDINYSLIHHTLIKKKYTKFETQLLMFYGGELYVHKNQLFSVTSKIIEYNNNYFDKKKLIIKFHPDESFEKEKFIKNIDDRLEVIPGNLLYYFTDCVIAYNSAVLYESANIGKKSISLLEMVDSKNLFYKKKIKRYLEDNLNKGSKIFYPKNFDELTYVLYS
mgnify:CR=1 FL=1|tara:strand:+ start:5772 stop:6818 length:1047 start_codon:yes stop_codon:yes gene_type:complete